MNLTKFRSFLLKGWRICMHVPPCSYDLGGRVHWARWVSFGVDDETLRLSLRKLGAQSSSSPETKDP